MSFVPKAMGVLGGAALGGIPGAMVAGSLVSGKKNKRDPRLDDPYYRPRADANGNPISTGGYRSGRGSSSLSV